MAGILSNLFQKTWTLADIMNVDASRQQKSSGCSAYLEETFVEIIPEGIIDKFKRFFTRNKAVMNTMYVIFKFGCSSETGHSYPIYMRLRYDPEGRLYTRNVCQIYCGCADFKFKSAWTLNQHSALFRSEKTELELGPAVTNAPKRKSNTTLCKHSYSAVMYLINNYQSLMGNV